MVFRSTAARKREQRRCRSGGRWAVRDGGCAFPGCGTPSGWCDAHHIVHWNDGGPTDLDNLILCAVITTGRCTTPNGGWRSGRIGKQCSIHRCRSIRISSRSAGTAHRQPPEVKQLETRAPGARSCPGAHAAFRHLRGDVRPTSGSDLLGKSEGDLEPPRRYRRRGSLCRRTFRTPDAESNAAPRRRKSRPRSMIGSKVISKRPSLAREVPRSAVVRSLRDAEVDPVQFVGPPPTNTMFSLAAVVSPKP